MIAELLPLVVLGMTAELLPLIVLALEVGPLYVGTVSVRTSILPRRGR
jgi:hypothetical protein